MLGFEERRLLFLYRAFYEEDYPAVEVSQNAHVKAQKMYYLLGLGGMNVGNHGFVWNQFGPFSDIVQETARKLDTKAEDIIDFYLRYPVGAETDNKIFSNESSPESLFEECDRERIVKIKEVLKISADRAEKDDYGDTPMRRWVELLGSLAYISQSMLPGVESDRLINKLKNLKEKYATETQENLDAINVLKDAKMLTIIGG